MQTTTKEFRRVRKFKSGLDQIDKVARFRGGDVVLLVGESSEIHRLDFGSRRIRYYDASKLDNVGSWRREIIDLVGECKTLARLLVITLPVPEGRATEEVWSTRYKNLLFCYASMVLEITNNGKRTYSLLKNRRGDKCRVSLEHGDKQPVFFEEW